VADAFDLSPSCIVDVLEGRQLATKGYKFKYVNGVNYRYPFPNDQIKWIVDTLKRDPSSRRMVVSAWAPDNAQTSKLPPCHCLFVVNVQNASTIVTHPEGLGGTVRAVEQRLCLHLTQRSCDIALGVPYNIASYALLMHLLSRFSGIPVGTFSHTLVDAHAYTCKPDGSMAEDDHVPGLREQLAREPRPLPRLRISDAIKSLADVEALIDSDTDEVMRHFVLEGYDPHPAIKFKVAV
jgi:thymidylate synthase